MSRLCTVPPAANRQLPHSPVVVSGETQSLLSRYDAKQDADEVFNAENVRENREYAEDWIPAIISAYPARSLCLRR